MDVWSQIMQLGDDFATKHYRHPTKLTVDRVLHACLVGWLASCVEAAATDDATISTLLSVPLVIDEEFRPGQLRIHTGEQFEDQFVILPHDYQRAFFVNSEASLPFVWMESRRACRAEPGAGWQPLGVVRDLTIEPPRA